MNQRNLKDRHRMNTQTCRIFLRLPIIAVIFISMLSGIAMSVAVAAELTALVTVKDQYPAVSPDGSRVVFESNRAGPSHQIFVLHLESQKVVQLTSSDEPNENPVWSPDGMKILFARRVADSPRTTWDVLEINADGTGLRNLTASPGHDDHPRYSPDGKSIVFNSSRQTDLRELSEEELDNGGYNYEIYSQSLAHKQAVRLTDYFEWDTYPSISPDGSKLLWRRVLPDGGSGESGLNSELFMADVDGSNIENLSNHPSFDGYPIWSPNGKEIAFASNRDGKALLEFNIYIMNIASRRIRRVTETIANTEQVRPAWFPDGTKIVLNRDYPDGRSEIHVVSVAESD